MLGVVGNNGASVCMMIKGNKNATSHVKPTEQTYLKQTQNNRDLLWPPSAD